MSSARPPKGKEVEESAPASDVESDDEEEEQTTMDQLKAKIDKMHHDFLEAWSAKEKGDIKEVTVTDTSALNEQLTELSNLVRGLGGRKPAKRTVDHPVKRVKLPRLQLFDGSDPRALR